MRYTMILLTIIVLLGSCAIVDPGYVFDRAFTLKYGSTAVLAPDRLKVGFKELAQDCRCPKNVVCVWEGIGEIKLSVLKPGIDTVFIKVHVHGLSDTAFAARQAGVDTLGYNFKLLKLDPYPVHGTEITLEQYEATLLVSRN